MGLNTCTECGGLVTGRRGQRCSACARACSRKKMCENEKNLEALGFRVLREKLIGAGVDADAVDGLIAAIRNQNSVACETRRIEMHGNALDSEDGVGSREGNRSCATRRITLRLSDTTATAAS